MKRILLLIAAGLLSITQLSAQNVVLLDNSTNGTTQVGCAFDFYDSGNSGANYSDNENFTITFNSNNVTYTHIRVNFSTFNIDNTDTLYIYDGSTTAAPLIGAYNNANPLTGVNNWVASSIYNASGDLTFRFKSNGSTNASGWFASIYCEKKCQQVLCAVDTLVINPLPNDSGYIDICQNEIVHFAALGAGPGAFPENDILYHQSNTTSTYSWDFGDGSTSTGQVVDHGYIVPNGYTVTLNVTDSNGCVSTMPLTLRVRISSNPIVDIKPLPDICVGDTIPLLVGTGATSTIEINPTGSNMMVTEMYDSTTFIPDGYYCPPGYYDTPVTFSTFPASATIQSASDIVSICINIEHSFAGDLGFDIYCPNGQNVKMDINDHGGGAFLGVPNETDDIYDDCNASTNPSGIGWTYCWSEVFGATQTMNDLDGGGSPIDSTSIQAGTDYILPQNSFTGLIGCPLNGTWSIRVTDDYGSDNGYVFYWTITLSNNTSFGGWSYEVPIDSVTWAGPYITATSDSTAIITPQIAGTLNYTATVWDSFGCSYDTTFTVEVLANPEPDLGADTTVCEGSVLTLDAGPGTLYFWSSGVNTQTINPDFSDTYAVTVTNTNGNVSCYGSDTIEVEMIPWASVNLGPDLCETAAVTLDAQNPGFDYHWSNGATSQTTNINTTGVYSVTVSYGGASECSDVDSINVSVIPTPNVNLGPDQEMCRHEFRDFDVSQSTPQYTYHWSTGSSSPYMHVEGLPVGPAVYSVTVTGCDSKSDTVVVNVIACDLTIPNIITPNGDGFNETFEVENLPYYPNSILMVYNRWGKKIYENPNYLNEWDGENFADGTYFFILRVNYGNEEYEDHHGTLTIMRE